MSVASLRRYRYYAPISSVLLCFHNCLNLVNVFSFLVEVFEAFDDAFGHNADDGIHILNDADASLTIMKVHR